MPLNVNVCQIIVNQVPFNELQCIHAHTYLYFLKNIRTRSAAIAIVRD